MKTYIPYITINKFANLSMKFEVKINSTI